MTYKVHSDSRKDKNLPNARSLEPRWNNFRQDPVEKGFYKWQSTLVKQPEKVPHPIFEISMVYYWKNISIKISYEKVQ